MQLLRLPALSGHRREHTKHVCALMDSSACHDRGKALKQYTCRSMGDGVQRCFQGRVGTFHPHMAKETLESCGMNSAEEVSQQRLNSWTVSWHGAEGGKEPGQRTEGCLHWSDLQWKGRQVDITHNAEHICCPAPPRMFLGKQWNLDKHSQVLTDCYHRLAGFLVPPGFPREVGWSAGLRGSLAGMWLGWSSRHPSEACMQTGEPKRSKSYRKLRFCSKLVG